MRRKFAFIALLVASLLVPSIPAPESKAAVKDTPKVLSAYASVLSKKKYRNENQDYGKSYFSLADLNNDGISELIISSSEEFMSKKEYFSYKKGKAYKLKVPKWDFYPAYGTLYLMPSRGSYAYYRGGPAYDNENGEGVMPYTLYEYKIRKGKITLVNELYKNQITGKNNKTKNLYSRGSKKCSSKKYESAKRAFGSEITFVANSKANRQMKGMVR